MRAPNTMLSSKQLLISNTELKKHRQIDQILEKAKSRTLSMDLVLSKHYDAYSTMCAYLYANADYKKVVDATIFFNILYFIDEVYGEDTTTLSELPDTSTLRSIWESGDMDIDIPEIKKLAVGMQKIKRSISKNSNSDFISKLGVTLKEHLTHVLNPTNYNSLDEYIHSRVHFSGMLLPIDLIEYTYNNYLPKKLPSIIKTNLNLLQQRCAEIGALSNDIFSYPKEKHSQFNLINVLIKLGKATDLEDAILKSIEIVNKKYVDFKETKASFTSMFADNNAPYKDQIFEYLQKLEDIIAGSYHWQVNTKRYTHKDHFFVELKI